MNLPASNITDTQFIVNWNPPEYLPGNLTEFEVQYILYPNLVKPRWCPERQETGEARPGINGNQLSWTYDQAIPFSYYRTSVRARTNAGWGNYSEGIPVRTEPGGKFNKNIKRI